MPTKIEWCDETFNPWWGCERVSPGCAHCYAATFSRRLGMDHLWPRRPSVQNGQEHGFRFFGDEHWAEPLKWARTLPAKLGRTPRVFCASMADVFEERYELGEARERLFALIAATPEIDWLVLTKRPEYARAVLGHPMFWLGVNAQLLSMGHPVIPGGMSDFSAGRSWLPNLWMGVSIETSRQTYRADVLREIPAAVRFISAEPLLGSLYDGRNNARAEADDGRGTRGSEGRAAEGVRADLFADSEVARSAAAPVAASVRLARAPLDLRGIDWLIIGGESGPGARPFLLDHARELVRAAVMECDHCVENGIDCDVPAAVAECSARPAIFVKQLGAKPVGREPLRLADAKGGDPEEWPRDLRIREWPLISSQLVRSGG